MTIDSLQGLELFTARTTNGTSTGQNWVANSGDAIVGAEGVWNGATVTFKVSSANGVTTQTAAGIALSETNPFVAVSLFNGEFIEAVIASAGASTSLTVWVRQKK